MDDYAKHAFESNRLLNDFLISVEGNHFVFTIFLAQIRKHILLAIFSTLRLHKIQALMDIRQVLEAESCAAFAIVNPDKKNFSEMDTDGFIDAPKKLRNKMYEWLEVEFPATSKSILGMKNSINDSVAHSNIIVLFHRLKKCNCLIFIN